ncbi:energy transducer TonB [Candidatus Synechococcus spongiarum]|uniref:Ferric siderophore transport system, periplasmic binding protein TonB n=1 Tax=Candidatus Synechococcus spongiarum TaxID=431041 RepID=A0A164Z2X8_9SYNE|nr:energy transducer TonB [Candidatus Synechococcus spongiarum]SAY38294.1 Ferric siderophore transport system, periplasmic binding protein TonB [Candidatus Synechococcus spongiarum]
MILNPMQWTLAFAAALTTHALAVVLVPQDLSRRPSAPPPRPVLVSLATAPAPVLPTPAVTPPAPVRPTPPLARQPEPEVSQPTPEVVVPPQPAPVPTTVKQEPLTQPSVAAVNPMPVTTPPAPSRPSTAAVSNDNRPPAQEAPAPPAQEVPATVTTAAAPTPVLDNVDLAQLRSQYGKTAHRWLNKHKRYPRRAQYRGEEGTVLVTFVVNRHGEVLNHEVERSSGNPLLDKEALAMIKRAQPLPGFSDELAKVKDTITVRVKVPFKLH